MFDCLVMFLFLLPETVCAGNPDAKRLYDDLLSNYNKLVRPVVNVTDALKGKNQAFHKVHVFQLFSFITS